MAKRPVTPIVIASSLLLAATLVRPSAGSLLHTIDFGQVEITPQDAWTIIASQPVTLLQTSSCAAWAASNVRSSWPPVNAFFSFTLALDSEAPVDVEGGPGIIRLELVHNDRNINDVHPSLAASSRAWTDIPSGDHVIHWMGKQAPTETPARGRVRGGSLTVLCLP